METAATAVQDADYVLDGDEGLYRWIINNFSAHALCLGHGKAVEVKVFQSP